MGSCIRIVIVENFYLKVYRFKIESVSRLRVCRPLPRFKFIQFGNPLRKFALTQRRQSLLALNASSDMNQNILEARGRWILLVPEYNIEVSFPLD